MTLKSRPHRGSGRASSKPIRAAADIDRGILDDLLGYHLRRAQAAVFADFMGAMAEERITPGQFGVLTLIERNPGLSQSALARVLGIERSTMVAVIDRLEARRLVGRDQSASDRRSYSLALSVQGKALLAKVTPKVRRHEKRVAAGFEPREVALLIDYLRRIGGTA